jgi:hypothetical protein
VSVRERLAPLYLIFISGLSSLFVPSFLLSLPARAHPKHLSTPYTFMMYRAEAPAVPQL